MLLQINTEVKGSEKYATLVVTEGGTNEFVSVPITPAQLSKLSIRAQEVYVEVLTYMDSDNEVYKKLIEQIHLAQPEELPTIQKTAVSLVETGAIGQRHLEELSARIEMRLNVEQVEELPEDEGTYEDDGTPTTLEEK